MVVAQPVVDTVAVRVVVAPDPSSDEAPGPAKRLGLRIASAVAGERGDTSRVASSILYPPPTSRSRGR